MFFFLIVISLHHLLLTTPHINIFATNYWMAKVKSKSFVLIGWQVWKLFGNTNILHAHIRKHTQSQIHRRTHRGPFYKSFSFFNKIRNKSENKLLVFSSTGATPCEPRFELGTTIKEDQHTGTDVCRGVLRSRQLPRAADLKGRVLRCYCYFYVYFNHFIHNSSK